tara:strand:- start:465 stop:638 length:174 start_codon:yes stop_codon:yes gene_type:complete
MIKKLKHFFCKLFGIKQCKCLEKDEHLQLYEDMPESDIPVYNHKLDKINRKHKKGKE